jgi:hypothetical protein
MPNVFRSSRKARGSSSRPTASALPKPAVRSTFQRGPKAMSASCGRACSPSPKVSGLPWQRARAALTSTVGAVPEAGPSRAVACSAHALDAARLCTRKV